MARELVLSDALRINCSEVLDPNTNTELAMQRCEERVGVALLEQLASDVEYVIRVSRRHGSERYHVSATLRLKE